MNSIKSLCKRFTPPPPPARLALVLAFALALAGCGGGGSSISGGGEPPVVPEPAELLQVVTDDNRAAVNTQMMAATAATPIAGSVTQSSRVDDNGATLDEVTVQFNGVTEDGVSRLVITNSGMGGWGTVDYSDSDTVRSMRVEDNLDDMGDSDDMDDLGGSDDMDLMGDMCNAGELCAPDDTSIVYRDLLSKATDNGTVYLDVYTSTEDADTTDYLTGGTWLFIPTDPTDDIEIGAFADTSRDPTPVVYLTEAATATYTGGVSGFVTEVNSSASTFGEFAGELELTAEFGSNPTVQGRVFDISNLPIDSDFISGADLRRYPDFMLEPADIDTTAASRFFTGATSSIPRQDDVSLPDNATTLTNFTGTWGGQFYGEEAESAAGTFGASATDDTNQISFLGTYGAEKDDPVDSASGGL